MKPINKQFKLAILFSFLSSFIFLTNCSSDDKNPKVEICNNGIDDDGDGFIDCEDFDCENSPDCLTDEICDNGIDDDGDGFIDCADFDCNDFPGCD